MVKGAWAMVAVGSLCSATMWAAIRPSSSSVSSSIITCSKSNLQTTGCRGVSPQLGDCLLAANRVAWQPKDTGSPVQPTEQQHCCVEVISSPTASGCTSGAGFREYSAPALQWLRHDAARPVVVAAAHRDRMAGGMLMFFFSGCDLS